VRIFRKFRTAVLIPSRSNFLIILSSTWTFRSPVGDIPFIIPVKSSPDGNSKVEILSLLKSTCSYSLKITSPGTTPMFSWNPQFPLIKQKAPCPGQTNSCNLR
jgi:hypothetical protein